MPRHVFAIVGEIGSGKGTFFNILSSLLATEIVVHIKSSDILIESLRPWGVIELTREHLQKFPMIMEDGFWGGILSDAVQERINKCPDTADAVFDGVRLWSDATMIRNFPNNTLIYITANQKIRFERAKARKEKKGEDVMTFEEFQDADKASTEIEIPEIGKTADFTIVNEGSLEDLKEQVVRVYAGIFRELEARREELKRRCENFDYAAGDAQEFKEIVDAFLNLEASGVTKLRDELGISKKEAEKLKKCPETLGPAAFSVILTAILDIITE